MAFLEKVISPCPSKFSDLPTALKPPKGLRPVLPTSQFLHARPINSLFGHEFATRKNRPSCAANTLMCFHEFLSGGNIYFKTASIHHYFLIDILAKKKIVTTKSPKRG